MPESKSASVKLYYAPRTRAFTALYLLEELGIDYELESFAIYEGRHKQPDYLALNPMGKVPLVVDNGVAVPEIGAMAIYLSDRYPESKLAPALDSPKRAEFLRWVLFASALFEPALTQKFMKWEVPASQAAWGSYEQVMDVATAAVSSGPWLLGDTFSAADAINGSNFQFGIQFGGVEKGTAIEDYVNRVTAREAWARAQEIEKREGERFPPQKQ